MQVLAQRYLCLDVLEIRTILHIGASRRSWRSVPKAKCHDCRKVSGLGRCLLWGTSAHLDVVSCDVGVESRVQTKEARWLQRMRWDGVGSKHNAFSFGVECGE